MSLNSVYYIYKDIYIIYRFYTDFSIFRQIKRQDTVRCNTFTCVVLYKHFSFKL